MHLCSWSRQRLWLKGNGKQKSTCHEWVPRYSEQNKAKGDEKQPKEKEKGDEEQPKEKVH